MSGAIGGAISGALDWAASLLGGTFRGVAFYTHEHDLEGGRRIASFEFPERDAPWGEDLGRKRRVYRFRAYVLGPLYNLQRDSLLKVLEQPGPGTLVHPYLGHFQVFCTSYRLGEQDDKLQYAAFDLQFTEQGTKPGPIAVVDTSSSLLDGITKVLSQVSNAYTLAYAAISNPAALLPLAGSMLGGFASDFLGGLDAAITVSDLATLGQLASDVSSVVGTALDVANAVGALFSTAAGMVVANLPDPTADETPDIIAGALPAGLLPTSDVTGGLAAFASWTAPADLGPSEATPASIAVLTLAIEQLVQGAAVATVATIVAQTNFASANAASAARDQLIGFTDTMADLAAANDQDALYLAWTGLGSLAFQDLSQRAQSLPSLVSYSFNASQPALVLANRLYQDATRAPQLVALNDARHPLFMPASFQALSA